MLQACYDLAERCGIQMSFKAQGLDEQEWLGHAVMFLLAFEDQCSPANPRLPLVAGAGGNSSSRLLRL